MVANDFQRPINALLLFGCLWLSSGCLGCKKPTSPHTDDQLSNPVQDKSAAATQFDIDVSRYKAKPKMEPSVSGLRFTEVHDLLGIDHVYANGANGELLAVETMGGGCAWLDFDKDGLLDLFLNQGGDPTAQSDAAEPVDALFRNLHAGFVNVAASARLVDKGYGQAVAVADFDNDGFDDVYVSNVFANTLWHNCGDGTFVEIAAWAGVDDHRWSSTAAWGDLNLDGQLDLYVCNYLKYDPRNPTHCFDDQGRPMLCNPAALEPWPDACYINLGDGTFVDEAAARGLKGEGSRALSVAIADFNNDRLPDIYVANDTNPNFLFINLGKGAFEDQATLLGCAVSREGIAQASMGLGVNDFDQNGYPDIYSTHYTDESNTLYVNRGVHGFQDATALMGLHDVTLRWLGFGTAMQDFDHDGHMDLIVTNGHVVTTPHKPKPHMPSQIFSYNNDRRWVDVGSTAGNYFQRNWMGRGLAVGDYDADGDLDVAILNQNDRSVLLQNDSEPRKWLNFAFVGIHSNRQGIGCRVEVNIKESKLTQELCGGTSYASSNQPLLSFGLGDAEIADLVVVYWPSGIRQELQNVHANQLLLIREPAESLLPAQRSP